MTWVLIFYMSVGFGTASTGGPAVIDGFTTEQNCKSALAKISNHKRFDWGYCESMVK
jgi:hypothetical protein